MILLLLAEALPHDIRDRQARRVCIVVLLKATLNARQVLLKFSRHSGLVTNSIHEASMIGQVRDRRDSAKGGLSRLGGTVRLDTSG